MMKIRFFKLWGTHALGVLVLVTVTVGMARSELQYGVASDGDALKHLASCPSSLSCVQQQPVKVEFLSLLLEKQQPRGNVAARMVFMLSMTM